MSLEIERYVAVLEQRLSLLRELAQQFLDCRKQFVAMDLDGMYARIAEQESLSWQIQSLHPEIDSLQRACARRLGPALQGRPGGPEDAAWAERLRAVMREMDATQAEVRRLSQIHTAYLRRSCRTVDVMMNFLGSFAFTYAPPSGSKVSASRLAEKG